MRDQVRRFLARHRRNKLVSRIGHNLGYYWQGFENQDYNIRTNGEEFVLRSVARLNPAAVVFDVGAHWGEWAEVAAHALPGGRIHSFEAVPATFDKLKANCGGRINVIPHNLALGEKEGGLEFSVAGGRDELSSGIPGVHGELHRFDFANVRCEMTTGDLFCAAQGIGHIDLLKIDVEGMEPMVLRGFAGMLAEKRIGAVQFEYGQVNLQARFFLGDFHALLSRHGMSMGKIYPNYVDFREYDFTQDTLSGPNFLAVPSDDTERIRLLRNI